MNDRPETDPESRAAPTQDKPEKLGDVSITDRWAPLIRDGERPQPVPPKMGQRILAAAACLIVLALFLWALT